MQQGQPPIPAANSRGTVLSRPERTSEAVGCQVRTLGAGIHVLDRNAPHPSIVVIYAERGNCFAMSEHGKHELRTDDFVVLDQAAQLVLKATEPARISVLSIPKTVAGHHAEVLQASAGLCLTAKVSTTASIVAHVLHALGKAADDGQGAPSLRVAQQIAGLVALSCLDQRNQVELAPAEDLLTQAQTYIESHLAELDLNQTRIARALNVSTRTLHRSFHAAGLSVNAWIRTRRLDECRSDLENPALLRLTVSAIGSRWGLPDAAHFSRLFKGTYGQSPRTYRQVRHSIMCASA